MDAFDALGVRVVGLSFDAPKANAAFRERNDFPFELWTDDTRALALSCGAARSARSRVARRSTMVVDADGRQRLLYPNVQNVLGHPSAVLDDVRLLFGATG